MNSLDYLARDEVLRVIDRKIEALRDNPLKKRLNSSQLTAMALRKEIGEMDTIGWKNYIHDAGQIVNELEAAAMMLGGNYEGVCNQAAEVITDLVTQLRIAEDSIERIFRNYRNLIEDIDKLQKYKLWADDDDDNILIRLKAVKEILGVEVEDGRVHRTDKQASTRG